MTQRSRRVLPWILASVLILAGVSLGTTLAGAWQAQEVIQDGVVHVMNPVKSMNEPKKLKLKEMWRVGGEDDEEIFGVITDIVADAAGNFYMLDSQLNEIKVYSADGEYLRTIGRQGEGPGEFQSAFNLFLVPGGNIGVLQAFPGKIVVLTPEGEPAGEFPLPDAEAGGFRVLFSAEYAGDNLALIYGLNQPSETGFTQSNVLSLVGKDGKSEVRLHSQDSKMQAATPLISEKEWDTFRNNRWAAAADGRAFAAVDYGRYAINVWDKNGKLERVIEREYPDHARSDAERERILKIYKGFTRRIPIPDMKFEIEDNHNQISQITVRDDGSLWVQTSRGANGLQKGVSGIWDVFDRKGRFVQQYVLEGEGDTLNDGYFFVKDRLFVVTDWLPAMMALQGGGGSDEEAEPEDEPELMQIISYRLNVPAIGG